ncbi:hypothetical protein [Streptomyces sp. NBC_01304]|uniref:hypothetical protein n=1 Tax=Streptomyces sp. NBC_01304 TaxID=2903818 RepID=UPI002E120D6A|nr:hypothetical protein OG430_05005 [Streptomyces sp. NBC_01304]
MRLKLVAPAIASLALIGTALTGGVAAATTHTATAAKSAPAACVYVEAAESVKIRKTKAVNGTALGLLPKGSSACTTNNPNTTGGSYNLCGHRSTKWEEITYRGIRGWIPYYCTRGV